MLPFFLNTISFITLITASLIKGKHIKTILLLVFSSNFLTATSYLIVGGINGAATCYLGAILSIINFFANKKFSKIPVWLNVLYSIIFIVTNIIVSSSLSWLGLIVIFASLSFVMAIGQENGKMYRFWTIINIALWCLYDFLAEQYSPLLMHIAILIFTLIGIIIHDFKYKKSQ